MMEYKGYLGKVEFDAEAGFFHGEVINTRDVITFQGQSVRELQEAFKDSIDDYLEFCSDRGEPPEKAFSGKLTIRLDPQLHRQIYLAAREGDKSLNSWISEVLQAASGKV